MTTLKRLYEIRKERWEDDRISHKRMTIKIDRPKKPMNWNGLKPRGG